MPRTGALLKQPVASDLEHHKTDSIIGVLLSILTPPDTGHSPAPELENFFLQQNKRTAQRKRRHQSVLTVSTVRLLLRGLPLHGDIIIAEHHAPVTNTPTRTRGVAATALPCY